MCFKNNIFQCRHFNREVDNVCSHDTQFSKTSCIHAGQYLHQGPREPRDHFIHIINVCVLFSLRNKYEVVQNEYSLFIPYNV